MENEMIDFDIGLGGGGGDDDDSLEIEHQNPSFDDDDEEDMVDGTPLFPPSSATIDCFGGGDIYIPELEGDLNLEPYDGMEFESEEASKAFYNSYARRVGFSTRVSSSRRSRRDGAIIQRQFVCAREGFRNLNEKRTKDREIKRPRIITRVGCKASLSVKIQDSSGKWIVSSFVKEHNHELVTPDQVHCLRSHRQISGPAKTLIDTLQAAGMGPRRIMSALIKEYGGISKVGFTEVDCRNYMRNNRQRNLEGDFQLLLDYLKQMHAENPSFFYAVQGDEDMSNVFWADSKAVSNYTYFGDTVTFDTSYRSNRYRLPFAPFTGINHHGQPVLFGCAFLINESETSFIWIFQTWLFAMSGRPPPISITTDHEKVISLAIMQVFPATRHRFCKWHILKKCQEKLSHVFLQYPNFEAEFHKCVNLTDSIDEFESCWVSLVDRYDLRGDHDHVWLQTIYFAKRQWVPVYLRDTFFAEMSTTHHRISDSMNSYFDGYINASTNLSQFFKQYEKAIESRNEKEVKADYDTMNTSPLLKTPSPMEKQASELYTRKLFARFQDELVGTLTCMASIVEKDDHDHGEITSVYLVLKYGEEEQKASYVKFNVLEMKSNCSCQMFEFSGILCRHVLAVFRVTNVLTLPSHYILKRWTRNAKSNIILEERRASDVVYTNYLESHTVRYNTLRHEAFKFADEGAKSIETYDAAINALQDASKKVSLALKNDGKMSMVNGRMKGRHLLATVGSHVNRSTTEDLQGSLGHHSSEDDMDKRIRQLSEELEFANHKCEDYRANLLSILKDIDDHKQQLSVKVQNVKLSMKDV